MKNITVIVRNLPMNTRRNAEALRMSVGLTLCGDRVSVIFIDDGVYSAAPSNPEMIGAQSLKKDFEAFGMLKCILLADKPSVEKRGIKNPLPDVKVTERDEIVRMITGSDIVIPF